MKDKCRLPVFLLCIVFGLCGQAAYADDEEDFEVQETGMFFDHARTGLLYKRALYLHEVNVTHVPYFPPTYNDTSAQVPGKVYVLRWEQDPPSFVIAYILNDTSKLATVHEIDVEISIAHHDRAKNHVVANRRLFERIPLEKGINRVPMNIHNYKGDIVDIRLKQQRLRFPILPIEVTD